MQITSRGARLLLLLLPVVTAAAALAALWGVSRAEGLLPLAPGAAAGHSIAGAAGDLWGFRGCAGEPITLTMRSTAFTPFLELLPADSDQPLADGAGSQGEAVIAGFTIAATGQYRVAAAGDRRTDRGPYSLKLTTPAGAVPAAQGALAFGAPATGTIRNQLGDTWLLHGCRGDVVTITLEGAGFAPFLEVLDAGTQDALADSGDTAAGSPARISAFSLPATGTFLVVAAGATARDRGAYTLTAAVAGDPGQADAGASPSAAAPPSDSTPTPGGGAGICGVTAASVNLRSGPGTVYQPPLGVLTKGTRLQMIARDLTGTWVEVARVDTGDRGWVLATPLNVQCDRLAGGLPVGVIPPTPTPLPPAPTPTPTATTQVVAPTATPPSLVLIPGGGGGDGWEAKIRTGPGMSSIRNGVAVFRNRLYVRLDINRTPDNRHVDRVEFQVFGGDGDQPVYSRTERTSGYCLFGGGEPDCNVLKLEPGVKWPGTDRLITNDSYQVQMDVYLDGDDNPSASWNAPVIIEAPALGNTGSQGQAGGDGGQQPLAARIVETGPGYDGDVISGAISFRVEANDPGAGGNDGDGIDYVVLSIAGPNGKQVHARRENNAAYCAFGGGEPDCNVWTFSEHGNAWPNGKQLQPGPHHLHAEVHAKDGRTLNLDRDIEIQ